MKPHNLLINFVQVVEHPKLLLAKFKGIEPSYARDLIKVKELTGLDINTFIDVGASEGQTAKAVHFIFPNAIIYSFEPVKQSFDILDRLREKIPNLQIFDFALGEKNGQTSFWMNDFIPASSLLSPTDELTRLFHSCKNKKKIPIYVERFDNLGIRLVKPVYLKIDVQGAENKVLEGFGELLKQVDVLQVEYSFKKLYQNQTTIEEILNYVHTMGFDSIYQLDVVSTKEEGLIYCDFVFWKGGKK